MPKPEVNLDAVGLLFDRLLGTRHAALLKAHAPDLHAKLVDVREHLPDVAAHLAGKVEQRAFGGMRAEAKALEHDVIDALDRALGRTRSKRLKAPKKAKKR